MQIEFVEAGPAAGEALTAIAALVFEGPVLTEAAEALDKHTGGAVSRAAAGGRFRGAKGQALELVAPANLHASHLLLVGAGPKDAFDGAAAEAAGAEAYKALKLSGATALELRLDAAPELLARAAFGARLASYRFDKYLTKEKPEKKPSIAAVRVASAERTVAQNYRGQALLFDTSAANATRSANSISPFGVAFGSLLSSGSQVGMQWLAGKNRQMMEGVY